MIKSFAAQSLLMPFIFNGSIDEDIAKKIKASFIKADTLQAFRLLHVKYIKNILNNTYSLVDYKSGAIFVIVSDSTGHSTVTITANSVTVAEFTLNMKDGVASVFKLLQALVKFEELVIDSYIPEHFYQYNTDGVFGGRMLKTIPYYRTIRNQDREFIANIIKALLCPDRSVLLDPRLKGFVDASNQPTDTFKVYCDTLCSCRDESYRYLAKKVIQAVYSLSIDLPGRVYSTDGKQVSDLSIFDTIIGTTKDQFRKYKIVQSVENLTDENIASFLNSLPVRNNTFADFSDLTQNSLDGHLSLLIETHLKITDKQIVKGILYAVLEPYRVKLQHFYMSRMPHMVAVSDNKVYAKKLTESIARQLFTDSLTPIEFETAMEHLPLGEFSSSLT